MEFHGNNQQNAGASPENAPGSSLQQDREPRYRRPIYHIGKTARKNLTKLQKVEKRRAKTLDNAKRMNILKFFIYRCNFGEVFWAETDPEEFRLVEGKLKSGLDEDLNAANELVEQKIKNLKAIVINMKSRLQKAHNYIGTAKLKYIIRDRESDLKRMNIYSMMIKKEIDNRKNGQEDCDPHPLSAEERARIQAKKAGKKMKKLQKIEKRRARNLENVEMMNIFKFLIYRCSFGKVHWAETDQEEYRLVEGKLKSGSDKDLKAANELAEKKITKLKAITISLKSTITRLREEHTDTGKLQCRLLDRESDLQRLNIYDMMIKKEIDKRKNGKGVKV